MAGCGVVGRQRHPQEMFWTELRFVGPHTSRGVVVTKLGMGIECLVLSSSSSMTTMTLYVAMAEQTTKGLTMDRTGDLSC